MPSRNPKLREHAAAKPTADELVTSRDRLNRVTTDFLKIEVEIGLTFLKIARETRDASRSLRNRKAARKAYDTLRKLSPRVELTIADDSFLQEKLTQMNAELQALGETF